MAAVGDDAKLHAAQERVPEPDRERAGADVELAGAERRDHLGAGVEHDEVDVQALALEVALVLRDVERRVAGRAAGADHDLVGRLRRAHEGGRHRSESLSARPAASAFSLLSLLLRRSLADPV